jgi:prepilin-type N-terminal cleavage/methylation domain-containing protein
MNPFDRSQPNTPRRTAARAFTLIEILIVIALTAVLFALLLIPLVSALRYTQQAQIVTAAQDAARITKERITRELSSAVFVFDGTSHPFQLTTGTTVAPGDDAYTNFLDLPLLSSTGTPVIAQAFNAKLDFVLPKLNDNGGTATIDPTTGAPINYSQSPSGSAAIVNPSYIFPLAAGTTMVRYWVGLKDPTKPYNNTREGKTIANGDSSDDNTYILYRAEVKPYSNVTDANGKITGVTPNTDLFAVRNNSSGVSIPELDDPDFFRYVSASDTDWLDDTHTTYGATTLPGQDVASHNARVDAWMKLAKAVIPGPNVDLLLLPHNADNTLNYDAGTAITPNPGFCTATSCPAIAHSGIAHDPVGNGYYPIVNTSVTFRPATVSGNATPGTTADYNSQGVVSVDQSGFTYIPTFYTATSQSWSLPYHVALYPGSYNAATDMYYDTEQFAAGTVAVTKPSSYTVPGGPLSINPGDILEYRHLPTDPNPQGTLVYNVTQGYPLTYDGMNYNLGGTQFAPMTINPDSGTISFTAPSLPNGPYDRLNRTWQYGAIDMTSLDTQNLGGIAADGTVELSLPVHATSALTDSPLQGVHTLTATGGATLTGVTNAHVVPGSVRVTGPDQTPGPNFGQSIAYTEVRPSVGDVGDNQFYIDYGTSVLHLLPGTTGVGVIYDYQANMSLTTPLPSPLPTTFVPPVLTLDPDYTPYLPYLPMQVTVDYQTRDLIDVSIGVRIYDITTNRAQIIPAETKIKIGNSNR